jgi:hypothetical protein
VDALTWAEKAPKIRNRLRKTCVMAHAPAIGIAMLVMRVHKRKAVYKEK